MKTLRVFLVLVVISLPLVFSGYGSDPDAWRIAASARHLWETGDYQISRFPGYPLYEIVNAPIIGLGGSVASNAATLLMTGLLLAAWGAFAQSHGRHPGFLLVLLAFCPLVWKNAATTMDYLWSLSFVVFAYHDAKEGRPMRTGLWIGIAGGIRLINAAAFIPAALLLHGRGVTKRDIAASWIISVGVLMMAFLPVIISYGIPVWWLNTAAQVEEVVRRQDVGVAQFAYRTVYTIGPFATLVLVPLVWSRRREFLAAVKDPASPLRGALAGILLFLALFARFPFEREYLLPAVPLLLLAVDSVSTRLWMGVFTAAVVSFAVVNPDVVRHGGLSGEPAVNVHGGVLVEEWRQRQDQLYAIDRVPSLPLPARSVLMTGMIPELWVDQPLLRLSSSLEWQDTHERVMEHAEVPDRYFVFMLSPKEIRKARDRGYQVWCLEGARRYLEQLGKYSMEHHGVGTVLLDSPGTLPPVP